MQHRHILLTLNRHFPQAGSLKVLECALDLLRPAEQITMPVEPEEDYAARRMIYPEHMGVEEPTADPTPLTPSGGIQQIRGVGLVADFTAVDGLHIQIDGTAAREAGLLGKKP